MQTDYLRDMRYKLQKRVRRLNAASHQVFLYELLRFLRYIDSNAALLGVETELAAQFPEAHIWVERIFTKKEPLEGDTEIEAAAIGSAVLRQLARDPNPLAFVQVPHGRGLSKFEDILEVFRSKYVEPFYEYVDEHLDDSSLVLSTLVRYKHGCEWFRRAELHALWSSETRRGEKALNLDLYRHLHEAGIDLHLEPSSASGEADLVSLQRPEDPLIADAKVFNPPSHGPNYLRRGFHQVYRYTCDYNRSVGYMIIFCTSETVLRLSLALSAEPVPRVSFNQKTIFILPIDIFPHDAPASRRAIAPANEVTEQYLTAAPETEA